MTNAPKQATKTAELIDDGLLSGAIGHDNGRWHCEYTPQDEHFWAPDHLAIRDIVIAEDVEAKGSSTLLDIRIELDNLSREVLQTATLRIHVRDAFGMTQFVWKDEVLDCLLLGDESVRVLHASIQLEREVLDRLAANGRNSLHLILEDKGGIVDDAIGELRVISG